MPFYNYKAREFSGKTITGTIEAETEELLLERLHRRNAVPLSIMRLHEPASKNPVLENLKISLKRISNPIKLQHVMMFTNQLSAMFGSGISLSKSLQSIAFDSKNKALHEIITEIYRSIEAGEDLSQAMERYPAVFNDLYVNLIRSGEVSGTLAIILPQLVSYLERALEVRGKIKAAITYPITIICFAFLVISILVLFIVPKFASIYDRLKTPLPLPTKILLNGSFLLRQHFLFFFSSAIVLLVLFFFALQTERVGFWWDKTKLRIPIFGQLLLKGILAKFSKTLSVLLQSGLPIIQSIQIVSESVGNLYLKRTLEDCTISIQKGASISQAFSKSQAFPDLLVQMISSGEESGTLHTMLNKTSDFYQQQVNSAVAAMTSIIEPVLIIVIGSIVAFVAISIFLPIFKMGGAL